MKTHPRLTGLCLLLIAMVFFSILDLDKEGGVLGVCGFLFFFVSGWMVLIFFWKDGDITKLRRIHKDMPQHHVLPAAPDREWTFRYPPMKGARLIVMVCLCLFMIGMATVSLLALISSANNADAVTREIMYFMFGVFSTCGIFICWLTWRYARLFIKVDARGITASTYFGMRHAEWEDIVALRDWIPFRGMGGISNFFAADFSLYKIYTHKHMISFSSSLPGADRLSKLILNAAGFEWT